MARYLLVKSLSWDSLDSRGLCLLQFFVIETLMLHGEGQSQAVAPSVPPGGLSTVMDYHPEHVIPNRGRILSSWPSP